MNKSSKAPLVLSISCQIHYLTSEFLISETKSALPEISTRGKVSLAKIVIRWNSARRQDLEERNQGSKRKESRSKKKGIEALKSTMYESDETSGIETKRVEMRQNEKK